MVARSYRASITLIAFLLSFPLSFPFSLSLLLSFTDCIVHLSASLPPFISSFLPPSLLSCLPCSLIFFIPHPLSLSLFTACRHLCSTKRQKSGGHRWISRKAPAVWGCGQTVRDDCDGGGQREAGGCCACFGESVRQSGLPGRLARSVCRACEV